MIIVDSCGWLEWFSDGKLADEYEPYLTDRDNILIPAIILFEVYKILKREVGEEKALLAEYQALAAKESQVTFVGRLGTYRYLDMDVTIREALDTARGFLDHAGKGEAAPAFFVAPV